MQPNEGYRGTVADSRQPERGRERGTRSLDEHMARHVMVLSLQGTRPAVNHQTHETVSGVIEDLFTTRTLKHA